MFSYIVLSFTFLTHFGETSDICLLDNDTNVMHVSGRCYWRLHHTFTFDDAHKRCQAKGGILAEIPDQDAQSKIKDFLFKLSQHESWIGVKNMNEEGNFENMLNEIVNYTNLESNDLNDGSNERGGCVSISYEIWRLKECSSYLPALCSLRYKPVTTDSPSILQTSMQTFSNVQSTIGTTLHVNQQRECMCPCSRMKNLVIIKNKTELLTKIDKMKKELAVKKSSLSSSIRKKTSAVDPRPSASIVGGTISVVIIATVVGLIVLSDLTRLINFLWKTIQKRCNRKTRAAQKGKV